MYAIIKTGGKQYRVQQGDVILVEKLDAKEGDTLTFTDVLLVSGDNGVKVGNPNVEGAWVSGTVLGQVKGEKLIVYKYKAKKNERKKQGHRQPYTKIEIGAVKG